MLDQINDIDTSTPSAPLDAVVVRFAGDSGDGIQTIGGAFTQSSALNGHDLVTFPDFPAEIRAPTGTTFGVSAFQIQFGGDGVATHGDQVDVLVAFNPAALKTNLSGLRSGGHLIVDSDSFTTRNMEKAGYPTNPLDGSDLDDYQVSPFGISSMVRDALAPLNVSKKDADKARNFWVLGLLYWMYGRDPAATVAWLKQKFTKRPELADANSTAMMAGHAFGETLEVDARAHVEDVRPAPFADGIYRTITGTDASVMGFAAVAALSGVRLHYCSYPITPASAVLHGLAKLRGQGISTFQAEDEIAAACAAVGASYAGSLGVTGTSGPGLALKAEALGLAVATELPLIVLNVQRAGPSTGMPTKTEQADLMMAIHGRHGEAPLPVLAPARPSECFDLMIEAARIAMTYMTPVIVLSDAFVANAAEPWRLPDVAALPDITPAYRTEPADFQPFQRDPESLARPWVRPGTPGLAHRLGGLERADGSGHISYDAENHQRMTNLRAEKMNRVAGSYAPLEIDGGVDEGDLLVIGWGSTHGALQSATESLCTAGKRVGHLQLRNLYPLPPDLGDICARYQHVVVAELNTGQLRSLIRDQLLIAADGINQISGQPFSVADLVTRLGSKMQ